MKWNTDEIVAYSSGVSIWNGTAPTATHITIGDHGDVNGDGATMLVMLFASLAGVSKLGTYQGTSPYANRVITTGFQPRCVMIKNMDTAEDWVILDSVQGFDKRLRANRTNGQGTISWFSVQSTGFTVGIGSSATNNDNDDNYIYYAIA